MKISIDKLRNENPLNIFFKEEINGINAIKPVTGNLTLTLNSTGVRIKGIISTILKLTCVRCLNTYFFPIKVTINENLIFNLVTDNAKDRELLKNDFVENIPVDNQIDLSDIIYQSVILTSPTQNICTSDCQGITSGSNSKDSFDPRLAKLKNLIPKNQDQ